jgi:hypothetical protein
MLYSRGGKVTYCDMTSIRTVVCLVVVNQVLLIHLAYC